MYFERHTHPNKELPLYFSFQTRNAREPKVDLHWHETAEWILIVSGSIEIRINDDIKTYTEGDVIFIPPQHPHSFRLTEGEVSYWCMIPDNGITKSAGLDVRTVFTENPIRSAEMTRLIQSIVKEMNEKPQAYAPMVIAHIVEMTVYAMRHHASPENSQALLDDNAMRITKDAIQYMEDHFAEDFGGEALAAHLGFSRSYLCHIISRVTGQSLTENLLYIRCRKAKEFLKKGISVGEAGYMAGFRNTSYFCRVYKRMMGVSPSAHRSK